jgi:hypothetical protein
MNLKPIKFSIRGNAHLEPGLGIVEQCEGTVLLRFAESFLIIEYSSGLFQTGHLLPELVIDHHGSVFLLQSLLVFGDCCVFFLFFLVVF